jgi:hypothetical protein
MDTELWLLKGQPRRLRDQSFADGFAEGFTQGLAEASAQRVAGLLESRGVEIPDRRALFDCENMRELNAWFEEAKRVAWINEIQAAHEDLLRRNAARFAPS